MSEDEEEEDEQVPDEIPRLRGILAAEVKNKNIKMSVQKGAFTYKDWHEMQPSYFKCTLQQGQPPSFP